MKSKGKNGSSSDLKKWLLFLLFPIAIFIVVYVATPGGESKARELISQARIKHGEARMVANETKEPQDLANVDIAGDALERAESFLIEGDYSNVIIEATKAVEHAQKALNRRAPPAAIDGLARFQEFVGQVFAKPRGAFDYQAVAKRTGLEIGGAVRTEADSAGRVLYNNGLETTIHPLTDVGFPDAGIRDASEGIQDFFLEDGALSVKTTELQGRRPTVLTNTAQIEIFPNSEVYVHYARLTKVMDIRVGIGRVDVNMGAQSETLGSKQQLSVAANQSLGRPRPLAEAPALREPENFAKFTANLNGFASVQLSWDELPDMDYRVELSAEPLFAKPLRTRDGFPQNRLAFADLTPGVYHWRVTAVDGQNESLPSQARVFEVEAAAGVAASADADDYTPYLRVTHVDVQGYIVIISGKAEPNADVMIEGEKAIIDRANGQFSYAASMPGKGVYTLSVVALNRGSRKSISVPVEIKD